MRVPAVLMCGSLLTPGPALADGPASVREAPDRVARPVPAPAPGVLPESTTAKLLREGTVACRPRVSHFCWNIHIGCIGRTRIETYRFTITLDDGDAVLSYGGSDTGAEPASRRGRVEPARDLEHIAIWLDPLPEAVKLNADGTYSFRISWRGTEYLSFGRCR